MRRQVQSPGKRREADGFEGDCRQNSLALVTNWVEGVEGAGAGGAEWRMLRLPALAVGQMAGLP